MTHHDIELYNPLIVNSTQGILNTIEYLPFYVKHFQKKAYLKGSSRKRAYCQQTLGEQTPPPLPPAPDRLFLFNINDNYNIKGATKS